MFFNSDTESQVKEKCRLIDNELVRIHRQFAINEIGTEASIEIYSKMVGRFLTLLGGKDDF
jgi:hypothetical protein